MIRFRNKKILTVLPRFCRPVKPPCCNLESSGDSEWFFCWSSDDSSFVAFDSRRSYVWSGLGNLEILLMLPLSVDVCLRPLFGLCRIVVDVRFILPDWIDRDIDETVGGIWRVTDDGRE
jgi:hypothetical protein